MNNDIPGYYYLNQGRASYPKTDKVFQPTAKKDTDPICTKPKVTEATRTTAAVEPPKMKDGGLGEMNKFPSEKAAMNTANVEQPAPKEEEKSDDDEELMSLLKQVKMKYKKDKADKAAKRLSEYFYQPDNEPPQKKPHPEPSYYSEKGKGRGKNNIPKSAKRVPKNNSINVQD